MVAFDTTTFFLVTSIALALSPGPDNLFVLTQSALYGRQSGFLVTLGLCTGLLGHTSAVALGVAAIFQTSELAFTLLKVLGAAYLLYLAWDAFHASAVALEQAGNQKLKARSLYYRGVVMNITNPKVAIFFLAFLPQFADPSRGAIPLQILFFGTLFIAATLFVFGTIAGFGGFLANWLRGSDRAQLLMHRIAGTVFVGLAFRLLAID